MRVGHLPRMIRTFLRPRVFTPHSPHRATSERAHPAGHGSAPWPAATHPDTRLEEGLTRFAASAAARHLHAVVIVRDGTIVAEHYGTGVDYRWGQRLRAATFTADTLHDLRSATKTVTALLYGIARHQGVVPDPSALLVESYPEHQEAMSRAGNDALTLHHVLSMTMGIEWNEHLPYRDPRNGEIAMELASDRFHYILSRSQTQPPGQSWTYCGGATALLGDLIERGTGQSLAQYAHEHLFTALGITHWQWLSGRDGRPSPASGLRLTARDAARVGQVLLTGGAWEGAQVVPAQWLALMTAVHTGPTWAPGLDYGYQTYIADDAGSPLRWIGGIGNGGQHIMALSNSGMVLVVYTGNYDGQNQGHEARSILTEVVGPAVTSH